VTGEGSAPQRPRGFFAILWEMLRALRPARVLRALRSGLRELAIEGAGQLALGLAACGITFALYWGFRNHPAATAAIAGPVALLAVLGAVLVVRTPGGQPKPYGKLGAAAAGTFGVVLALLYGLAQADCLAC
jgi:hypothetical protein